MKNVIGYVIKSVFLTIILISSLGIVNNSYSQGLTIDQIPLFLTNAVDPRVMLVMSRDHQLYIKAYTDYSDLDGDGVLDTTYNDKVNYSGYFDSNKCYTYTNSRFEPKRKVPNADSYACGGAGEWSGNFLNWATMTRMDLVRKVLYGGYRSTDSISDTVLERVLLPYDVHSFVKVFKTTSTNKVRDFTPYDQTSISICNLTQATGVSKNVSTITYPPLIRVASSAWPRWASSEVTQCQWGSGTQPGNSSNLVSPNNDTGLNVRVKVCVSDLEEENCLAYGSNKKPIGLLQKYGKPGAVSVRFGLMTGSYGDNKSGGVLRRTLSRISDNPTVSAILNEFNKDTGQFVNQGTTNAGIINTLNRFRISSYDYTNKKYTKFKGSLPDSQTCATYGTLVFPNGECADWGNPLGETYLEMLRYLAGKKKATPNFDANDVSFIPSLPQVEWDDPMPEGEWCAYNTAVVISTGLNSFDTDELSNELGIDVKAETNQVGALEKINGSTYLIGNNGTTNDKQCTAKSLSGLADAKGVCPEVPSLEGGYQIAGLSYYAHTNDIRLDREEKQLVDTYTVALAESLPRFEIPVGSDKNITLLPACMANNNGSAPFPNTTDYPGLGWRVCSMTDLIVEQATYKNNKIVSGSFLINWEDSTWGNDYDMDGIERLAFCIGSACSDISVSCATTGSPSVIIPWPTVASNEIAVISCAAQAVAGNALLFGYTITGSNNNDGFKPTILRPGSSNFNVGDKLPSSVTSPNKATFATGNSAGKLLENPLFYAAKYGAFKDENDNNEPDLESEWNADNDSKKIPDGFNQVKNPAKLEKALDDILANVIKVAKETGSSTSVTTNSTRLETSSLVYQAQFTSSNWTGRMFAYSLFFDDPNNPEGSIGNQVWDVTDKFPTPDNRKIFSYDPELLTTKGIEFTWDDLSDSQRELLDKECFDDNSCIESMILNYLRGDDSEEAPVGPYRSRTVTVKNDSNVEVEEHLKLGDIVNSDPWFVGIENFGYNILPNPEGAAYLTYRSSSSYVNRRKMIYVGANDGFLHGFDATDSADGGKEILAYVPNTTIISQTIQSGESDLRSLTRPSYTHKYFVDGSPRAGDVYFGGAWHTVLAGTLGAGGKGIFALDVTNPDAFTKSNILWEINTLSSPNASDLTDTSSQAGFANNLGYTFSQPSVVRMANGKWAVIIGNGYNSTSQKAVLYIIDAETGHLIKSIDTKVGSATQLNGLSTPIAVDVNDDRIVDAVYAGDLQGNLWKFDVSDSSTSNWGVAFMNGASPKPLFVAKDANNVIQPITAKPQVGKNPAGGVLVYFGTGRYFVEGDNDFDDKLVNASPTPPTVQTFYAVWDNNTQVTRSDLVAQTIITELVAGDFNIRITTDNEVDYTGTAKGWYLDLVKPSVPIGGVATAQGERVVAVPVLRPGNRIVFTTVIPSLEPCEFGGTSWLMELEATTGKRLAKTFDLNGDWKVDSQDTQVVTLPTGGPNGGPLTVTVAASGKQSEVGIIKTPGIIPSPGGGIEYKYTSGTKQCTKDCIKTVKGSLEVTAEDYGANVGRQSWRQLR